MTPVTIAWTEPEQVESLRAAAEGLGDCGWSLQFLARCEPPRFPPDGLAIVAARSECRLPETLPPTGPVIRIAGNDSGGLLEDVRHDLERYALVVKTSGTYQPPELHHETSQWHLDVLGRPLPLASRRVRPHPVANAWLARVVDGPCSHLTRRTLDADFAAPPNLDGPWEHDVSFVGTAAHPLVRAHRAAAVAAIADLARTTPGLRVRAELLDERLPRRAYREIVRGSRITVSPWGYGEFALRDYEAMAAGSVVVKPACGWFRDWADSYRAGETYAPCRPDFADLGDVVRRLLDHWDALRPGRLANRERLERHRALSHQVAAWHTLFVRAGDAA